MTTLICKRCKSVILDTDSGEANYSLRIRFITEKHIDDLGYKVYRDGGYEIYAVCGNCKRVAKIPDIGINLNELIELSTKGGRK